ncbi:aspartyl/asparaginyl beta-hydroxylase isoform X2 [Hoplias malabaricus]|uniref:aspartyl/asparaginyl beta-hydroxylase isoform X2 n=1 Tax=Hoplias malabaricus TaxID=27720 RepID=UPI0034638437
MGHRKPARNQAKKEPHAVPAVNKSSKKAEGHSIFTWLIVLSLLGVWMSVAVVWFDLVDYSNVVGTLGLYDADGDGDFDVEDAKVMLGLKETTVTMKTEEAPPTNEDPTENQKTKGSPVGESLKETENVKDEGPESVTEDKAPGASAFHSFDSLEIIDSTGELVVEDVPEETLELAATERYQGEESNTLQEEEISPIPEVTIESVAPPEKILEPEPAAEPGPPAESTPLATSETSEPIPESPRHQSALEATSETTKPGAPSEPTTESHGQESAAETTAETEAKKKKPKFFNKFDKTIKSEINAAEKLRKNGKVEEALRAFETLVQKYPQSPRSRYGKAQAEDDMAEKLRSNEMLLKAVNTYREAADLPDAPAALIKATLKRRADRQQFLGRTKGSLATLEKLVQIFPEDIILKNDLGVAHLLVGDNSGAKQIYEEVLAMAPNDGFAKVHYGFILKSENKIEESIPYLRDGLKSGAPGTDDGRFYFHLGDALQRMGDMNEAYDWYETGYQHGHFASVWQRSLYNVAGLRAQPWWTAKETGYTDLVRMLEKNWMTIRDEALAVLDSRSGLFLPEDENLRETGDWGQFTLWQQGRKAGISCKSVPKTCALMERYPEATSCKRGQIKYSVMQPGTHVWPHTGPTNCRLRMHLGLVIPRPGCRIRCTNQTREWEEGKVLIFDDSFEHEVWQDADSYRLIFIVDVWHPELSQSQRHMLSPI